MQTAGNELQPVHKDNKCIAIFAMNMAALCCVGMTSSYRVIAREGFHAAELNLVRNGFSFTVAIIWCLINKTNPLSQFPSDKKGSLATRCVSGQMCFLLVNIASPFAPLSLIMVIRSIHPFFTSLIALLALGEPISLLEILSICVCFCAVVVIATQQQKYVKEEDVVAQE